MENSEFEEFEIFLKKKYPLKKVVKKIDLSHSCGNFDQVLIKGFPLLEEIDLSFNKIKKLEICKISALNLKFVNVKMNYLKDLNFLSNLNCGKIYTIDVSNNCLKLNFSKLIEINRKFINLEKFILGNSEENHKSRNPRNQIFGFNTISNSNFKLEKFELNNANFIEKEIKREKKLKEEVNKIIITKIRKNISDKERIEKLIKDLKEEQEKKIEENEFLEIQQKKIYSKNLQFAVIIFFYFFLSYFCNYNFIFKITFENKKRNGKDEIKRYSY